MDSLRQIQLTRELVDIDSTTGAEATAGRWLASMLRDLGWTVTEQPVDGDRFNVIAAVGSPDVVFSTHFDCVPPFFASRETDGRLFGRGACDAKGILMAQVSAAERLRAAGESGVGLLFVVGEERGSLGAKAANTVAPGSRYLINGEPTGNRLGRATRGAYRVRLSATGRAAHSSQPELGESAIDKLVDALVAVREIDWPADPDLGRTICVTGLIRGGVAPNVVPFEAEAELMFRTVGDYLAVRQLLEAHVGSLVTLDREVVVPLVALTTVPGIDTEVFSYTTDIPFLDRWGAPLLLGPGAIAQAHTVDESVGVSELLRAVDLYELVARTLLN